MGYAVYWIDEHHRFAGYGVPCECEHPKCRERIHRGMAYACGGEPRGGEHGCGLHFCGKHLAGDQLCPRCSNGREPFAQKPDIDEWSRHMLEDESWQVWRDENPSDVAKMKRKLERVA